MRNWISLFLLLAAAVIAVSCGNERKAKNFNNKTQVDDVSESFIKKATEAGFTEIKASAIAETLSKNPRVVRFAKMILEDHTEINKTIVQIDDNKFANNADSISAGHQKKIDSIARLSNVTFDKAYMNMMLNEHNKAIVLFEEASANKNTAVQQFAKKTFPTIKMHLDSAKAIAVSLK